MTTLGLLRMMQKYEFVRQAVENSLPHRNLEVRIKPLSGCRCP